MIGIILVFNLLSDCAKNLRAYILFVVVIVLLPVSTLLSKKYVPLGNLILVFIYNKSLSRALLKWVGL